MKRSLADMSIRSTAGCLPVPLFNQKKRNRQPLTSNPIKNEPGTSSGTHTYNISPTSFGWGAANPEAADLQKTANNGATVWNRNEYAPARNTADAGSGSGMIHKFESLSNSLKNAQQQTPLDHRNSSQRIKTTETSQTYTPNGQWPVQPNTVPRSLQDHSLAYKFNHNVQQKKTNEKPFDCVPEGKSQEFPSSQLKIKEKKNSFRIVSAVIESMKHWSQYANKTTLLFEVLGTLDSAVTLGDYGAKTFLLRDGKESLPCVFYEIDQELPRLIRGRVHRCMGNYDAKRNVFKCFSVRPATIQEQNTFQDFVKVVDAEMTAFVKTLNEM
ncbi:PREDICTED: spermatogenesis-associated protein 22 [Buceros rhinoceros silvestris]|uniref:spermatogenesis-associated protein 22 n=1 Tax=Buceros rhinoceros silvestris TaxID=175836 RepID=UPI000528C352|nr:PREDICTED: spermatogenesis-associated protein 22 [Buceros rhinoceros silvestris]